MDVDSGLSVVVKYLSVQGPDGKPVAIPAEQRRKTLSLLYKWYAEADEVSIRELISATIKAYDPKAKGAIPEEQFGNMIFQMLQSASQLHDIDEKEAAAEAAAEAQAAQPKPEDKADQDAAKADPIKPDVVSAAK